MPTDGPSGPIQGRTVSHKDAPPETKTQIDCREFWQKAQPHVTRAWGRAKDGNFLAEESRLLHKSWEAAIASVKL